ncbi:Guanine nucleotide-binding protein subunit gamma [Dirofilaria immitis]
MAAVAVSLSKRTISITDVGAAGIKQHYRHGSWVDPNDPFASSSFCTKNTVNQLTLCQMNLKECLKNSKVSEDYTETPYVHDLTLKHIIRNFLHRMNVDIDKTKRVDRTVEVYLDADSLVILRKYLNSKDETVTVREQVREIMEKLIVPRNYEDQSFVERILDVIVTFLPLLNTLLLIPAIVVLYRSHFSICSFVWLFFFVSFVISVFNTFHKKYQANIAVRMSRAEKSLAEKCKTDNTLSTVLNMVSGLFVLKQENECEQHYRDLYVDPIYEISPLDVICEVLSSFVFTSLGVFGRHFNIFFNEFFRDSPLHFIVLKAIIFLFLTVVFLFWLGGYRIRTFMATVEPSDTIHSMSRLQQTADYRSNGGRPEIRSSGSGILLSPVRVGSNNTRRRSLSTSRLRMRLIGYTSAAIATNVQEISQVSRKKVSEVSKDLIEYCEREKPHDMLVSGPIDNHNPFQEKKSCAIL